MNRSERRRQERERQKGGPPDPAGNVPVIRGSEEGCFHQWQLIPATFSCGTQQDVMECMKCGGLVQPCEDCSKYPTPESGRGGRESMPDVVSEEWVKEHICGEDSWEVHIPWVRMVTDGFDNVQLETHAEYVEDEENPGHYELSSFSG